jgi:Bacterial Ig-like domain (group 3)/Galactose oxidase, central domain
MTKNTNTTFAALYRLGLIVLTAAPCFPQAWTQLEPTGTPPVPRGFHGVTGVYDPGSNRMIVFAGRDADGNNLNDVWVLTNANGLGGTGEWINLIPNGASGSPPPRSGHSAVYDSSTNRMIIFGGCNGFCLPTLNDTWVLSNANGLGGTPVWTPLSPPSPPAARTRHVAAYDQVNNVMMIFAGQNGGGDGCATYSDVQVLSNANGLGGSSAWTQLSPSGGPPAGQYGPSAIYDPGSNQLTVFGGGGIVTGVCQSSNASWALSNANGLGGTPAWTNLTAEGAAGSPPARGFHTAVYRASTNEMTIYGGTNSGGPLGDVWGLSNANGLGGTAAWGQIFPSGGPPAARDSHAAVLDPVSNQMTIFGGNGAAYYNDTWVLSDATFVVYSSTTTISDIAPNPAIYDQPVTITATVTNGSGTPPSGGTVTFYANLAKAGTVTLGTAPLSNGTASITTPYNQFQPVENYQITASFSGNTQNEPSSTSKYEVLQVNPATTTTTLASSVNPATIDQKVTFTATVQPEVDGTPTGSVTFYNGGTALQTVTLVNGVATYSSSALPKGSLKIKATYNGSTGFESSSGTLTEQIY